MKKQNNDKRSKSLSCNTNTNLTSSLTTLHTINTNTIPQSLESTATNIEVHVRIRPPNKAEALINSRILLIPTNNKITVDIPEKGDKASSKKEFYFDKIYSSDSTQEEVYLKAVKPNLLKALEGYNLCLLAYGQTGSGKTFTMGSSYTDDSNSEIKGVIPRLTSDFFSLLTDEFQVKVSFLELYNEEIRDLLCIKTPSKQLVLKEDKKGMIYIPALSQHVVCDSKDAIKLLWTGSLNRKVGSTFQNDVSSRSHAVFLISVEKTDSLTKQVTSFKITVVDLAGSEKLKKSGATGERMKEGISINAGLLSLSKVVMALADEQKHIPYRDSKLTRLLKDSLGGNSLTVMMACVSPCESNLEESINTLNYASFARCIKVKPKQNLIEDETDALRRENAELKEALKRYQDSNQLVTENNRLMKLITNLKDKILYLKSELVKSEGVGGFTNNEGKDEIELLDSIEELNKEEENCKTEEDELGCDETPTLNSQEKESKRSGSLITPLKIAQDDRRKLSLTNKLDKDILERLLSIEKEKEQKENDLVKQSEDLKEEVALMKEKEQMMLAKLEHAALIIGEHGRERLAATNYEEDIQLTSRGNKPDIKELEKKLQKKEIETEKLKQLLEKHMRINMTLKHQLSCIKEKKEEKSDEISIINSIEMTELDKEDKDDKEDKIVINENLIIEKLEDAYSTNKPGLNYISKLKTFQETLKTKILEAELYKKKILIEKNEEITLVKRNLTDKEKEIKKLKQIKEKNEMMLEITAKEIVNLRQEISKRGNSVGEARKKENNTEQKRNFSKGPPSTSFIYSSNKNDQSFSSNTPLVTNISTEANRKPSSRKIPQMSISSSAKKGGDEEKKRIEEEKKSKKELSAKKVKPKTEKPPCFTDTKEQFILAHITSSVKKLEEMMIEKTKLLNKKDTLKKELEDHLKMKKSDDFTKQKLFDQKTISLEVKINGNNISCDKIDGEINDLELQIKDNLTKLNNRISQMNSFIDSEPEVEEKEKEVKVNEDHEAKLFDLEEKLVFIELENILKDKRVAELEILLKEKIDYYEEQLLMAVTAGDENLKEININDDDQGPIENLNTKPKKFSKSVMSQYGTNVGNENFDIDEPEQEKQAIRKPMIPKAKK